MVLSQTNLTAFVEAELRRTHNRAGNNQWRCHEIARHLARTISEHFGVPTRVCDGMAHYRGDAIMNPDVLIKDLGAIERETDSRAMSLADWLQAQQEQRELEQEVEKLRAKYRERGTTTPHSWCVVDEKWTVDFHYHLRLAGGERRGLTESASFLLIVDPIDNPTDGVIYVPCGDTISLFGHTLIRPNKRNPRTWTMLRR